MGSPCGPGEGLPEWCLGGGPGRGVSPSFPKSSLALGETEGRGCGRGGGFLSGLARRLSRVRSAFVFHVTSPLNRSIPDASRFLCQSSPEPVGTPVQEERDA